jgi:hypothetical protein
MADANLDHSGKLRLAKAREDREGKLLLCPRLGSRKALRSLRPPEGRLKVRRGCVMDPRLYGL